MDWNILKVNEKDEKIVAVHGYLQEAIHSLKIPGASILFVQDDEIQLNQHYGYAQVMPTAIPMQHDSIFDLASLTKIVATWPAIMILLDQEIISLEHKLADFYDYPMDSSLKNTNISQLLTHTSGLSERTYLKQYGYDKETILQGILRDGLKYPPGQRVQYCNRGFVLLGDIIERASGMDLDSFLIQNIWQPLGMTDTMFNPSHHLYDRIVATEYLPDLKKVKRGIVHDENAELLGGIAGHAGTFSTVTDLGKFCSFILDLWNNEERIFSSKLVRQSLDNLTKSLNESRGLAWQIFHEAEESLVVGHYGFTGTTIWIDVKQNKYMVLLTNRVHPSRENMNIRSIRNQLKKELFT